MRYSQSEKMQVIRLVEESPLSVKQTLRELNINRSTFYQWYRRYQEGGYDALACIFRSIANRIPFDREQRSDSSRTTFRLIANTIPEHPEPETSLY
jgi:hypothetical protein